MINWLPLTNDFSFFSDIGEVIRTRHQQRRRTLSAGKKDSEAMKAVREREREKLVGKGNIYEMLELCMILRLGVGS
jgi:hypothetical protein